MGSVFKPVKVGLQSLPKVQINSWWFLFLFLSDFSVFLVSVGQPQSQIGNGSPNCYVVHILTLVLILKVYLPNGILKTCFVNKRINTSWMSPLPSSLNGISMCQTLGLPPSVKSIKIRHRRKYQCYVYGLCTSAGFLLILTGSYFLVRTQRLLAFKRMLSNSKECGCY